MSILQKTARRVRHLPVLKNADWLWDAVRWQYRRLLAAGGNGVKVMVGGIAPVRIPSEFIGSSWDTFEPEAVAAFHAWVSGNPDCLILDAGSSIGIFSAIALFANPSCRVVAFDSDLASLAAALRMCSHASGQRLEVVNCLLTDSAGTVVLSDAVSDTRDALKDFDGTSTQYICLTDAGIDSIPLYRIDDLLPDGVGCRKVLLKCDVEGAELLVLRGAEGLLRRDKPTLLVSVHPPALPSYGHSPADVRSFLTALGYSIRVLAIDHEEHWWCEHSCCANYWYCLKTPVCC
jgi:FkbM family methyltransferase